MFTMRRRALCKAVVASLASAAMLALPVSAEPKRGGTVVITSTPEPPILTNALSSAPVTNEVATKIFDGLLEYDMDLNPLPSLATSWEVSDDGKTVTFNLRDDVTWHDGGRSQTKSNSSPLGQSHCPLDDAELAPLGKGGGTVQLEDVATGEAAVLVEMVEYRRMNGGEFL